MNIIIIQARSTSTRLPNKSLAEIGGIPLVRHCYNSCIASGMLTIVALPSNDVMIPYLAENHIPYFEGSEDDVLARYYHCAKTYGATGIMRITGDCPLIDLPYILFTQVLFKGRAYASVDGIDGQEVEMFTMELLELAHKEAQGKADREHVTTWMRRYVVDKKQSYAMHTIPFTADKMSVDTEEDLERVRKIYANRHPSN